MNNLTEKNEFIAIDYARIICAVLIVIMHMKPLDGLNESAEWFLDSVLTRVAVPFFFLTSGFFFEKIADNKEKIRKYILRLTGLYVVYSAIYFPYVIKAYIEAGHGVLYNIVSFTRTFLFIGTFQHLWYFPALLLAVFLILFLEKERIPIRGVCVLAIFLYVIGTIGNAYICPYIEALAPKENIILWLYYKIFNTTRNGLFFGFPYVFAGFFIAKKKNKIKKRKYFLLFVFWEILTVIEASSVRNFFGCSSSDMLFLLAPATICMFLGILFVDVGGVERRQNKALHCRKLSVLLFGLHLIYQAYFQNYLTNHFGVVLNNSMSFVLVLLVTFSLSELIIFLSENVKRLNVLKFLY